MNNRSGHREIHPYSSPITVVDNFLPVELASAMRRDIDNHIDDPHAHRSETHQIWNYWFVPGLYTYLRTRPENVLHRSRVDDFLNVLRGWSIEKLGLSKVSWPYLSLYVCGCSQGLHNDSKNGRFAFVYSLTKTERKTIGGETIILREGDLFRLNLQVANAGVGFYELIAPTFNRLVIFDDRLVHGVQRLDGSMDPAHGRWVLHGHIEEGGPIVIGRLTLEEIREEIYTAVDHFVTARIAAMQLYHGPLVLRFRIAPEGGVTEISVLLDRVIHEQEGDVDWELLRTELTETLRRATFPVSGGETVVTLPMTFGGRLQVS